MNERELFWDWAKNGNPQLIEEVEKGCQFAKNILDYMFTGWQASANRQDYKLVPVEPDKDTIIRIASVCIGDDFANLDEANDLYKAMIDAAGN